MKLDNEDELIYESTEEHYKDLIDFAPQDYKPLLEIPDIGECYILVEKEGGMTPHFELHSVDESFKTCLEIFEPKYYFRGRDFQKLSDNQIDGLIKYLKDPFWVDNRMSNFFYIAVSWCNRNEGKLFYHRDDNPVCMPDYSKLKL